jgi:hypothetical protein
MNITSKKVTSQIRFAHVAAESAMGVTLNELEAFLVAAKAAEVPGDTPIEVQGFMVCATTPFLRAQATVEVQD